MKGASKVPASKKPVGKSMKGKERKGGSKLPPTLVPGKGGGFWGNLIYAVLIFLERAWEGVLTLLFVLFLSYSSLPAS